MLGPGMLSDLRHAVAILCVVWGIGIGISISAERIWIMSIGWFLAGALLWIHRSQAWGGLLVVVLCGLTYLFGGLAHYEGLHLMTWMAAAITITADRPTDRDRLTRWLATSVYAFAALSKLNPTWLEGEDLTLLLATRPHLATSAPLIPSEVLGILPVVVIAVEAFLAIGLWFPRTRTLAVVLGVAMHVSFIIGATNNPLGFCHLLLINGGLMACYPSFRRLEAETPVHATAEA